MRYLASFSYDGSFFSGFQRQKNKKTVQGVFEEALSSLNEKDVSIHASGRTDKGVHAKCQCAHFDLDKKVKLYNLKKYLNRKFDGEIYVFDIKEVDNTFHARYDVKDKVYSYYINMGQYNPMMRNYINQYCDKLDVSSMKKASKYLIGEHDFRSFCTDSKTKENCVRTIYDISFDIDKEILKITFKGNGFLRKMIRNIVILLIEIGKGEKEPIYMKEILDKKNRSGNLKCASALGLYLEKVNY